MTLNESDIDARSAATRCSSCGVYRNEGDRCDYCGALYLDRIAARPEIGKRRSLGEKYKVDRTGKDLRITWNWRNGTIWFLIPFFIFWNSIAMSFVQAGDFLSDPLSAFPIPGIHLIFGVLGIGYVMVSLINRTTILAKDDVLSLRHHPIPWPGNVTFEKDDIESLFVSKTQRSSKKNSWNVPVLQLVTKAGLRYELLKGKTEVEFADFESLRLHLLEALHLEPKDMIGAIPE
ncbi:hypothetical protein AAD018_005425 [Aestuariibius insulae]|uniref:hypothetical protein n=1 Tax=Aestuariibius insulae TaxID=2058287 RepID=UPI00345E0BE7